MTYQHKKTVTGYQYKEPVIKMTFESNNTEATS